MRFTVLGGDMRSVRLIDFLKEDGHRVKSYGIDGEITGLNSDGGSLEEVLEGSSFVLGPVPTSRDGVHLHSPLSDRRIIIRDLMEAMDQDQVYIGAAIGEEIKEVAKAHGIRTIDLLDREEMAVLNALATAEGAIQVAMRERDVILQSSQVMILGFGRIGKLLAKSLQGLGANPYVVARKKEDLAWIQAYGYRPLDFKTMDSHLGKIDLLYNTVPQILLTRERLEVMRKDCLIVDLASEPGGLDRDEAEGIGIKSIWALGLPGKLVAGTGAQIIRTTIYNIIDELGVGECC